MHSSISNSNDRLPKHDWQQVWIIALSIVIVFISVWESIWRLQGFEPSLNDDAPLWINVRKSIPANDPKAIVLIGASRIQLDVNIELFEQQIKHQVFQLAINGGTSPIPVLAHLANDPTFKGLIICDINELNLTSRLTRGIPEAWIKMYHNYKFKDQFEFFLHSLIQKSFIFRLPALQPANIFRKVKETHKLPVPSYLTLFSNRFMKADYLILKETYNSQHYYNTWIERYRDMYQKELPILKDVFEKNLQHINTSVKLIQQRGGNVIFIRLPSSGKIWEMDNMYWPKDKYWDIFTQQIPAVFIHFNDYPELQYSLFDDSHLDFRQTIPFTKSFAYIINALELNNNR